MDKLSIINNALLKVALPPAAALDDCDWNAGRVFESSAEECLRAHGWSFAMRYATLEQLESPPFGFKYAYQMPEDCVRVVDIRPGSDLRSPRARFVTRGRQVFTNANPANTRYTGRELDTEIWPGDFANAVSCRIAAEIAGLSAEKIAMIPQLMQLAQIALNQAIMTDAREETERVPLDDSLYASRGER